MAPIDIQVSRSKVSIKGQAYSLYVGEGGAVVFYKQLYFNICIGNGIKTYLLSWKFQRIYRFIFFTIGSDVPDAFQ